jgi:hypothetical protein
MHRVSEKTDKNPEPQSDSAPSTVASRYVHSSTVGICRLVWSGSGLKSTWMENAHFVEVERHPLYTRRREIFEAGEGIVRDSVGF